MVCLLINCGSVRVPKVKSEQEIGPTVKQHLTEKLKLNIWKLLGIVEEEHRKLEIWQRLSLSRFFLVSAIFAYFFLHDECIYQAA